MKFKTNPIWFLASFLLLLTSCSEAYKEKRRSAENYLGEMTADNVIVGAAVKSNNGVSMNMTTVKFEGVSASFDDLELEQLANKFAWDFYTSLSTEYFKDETHLEVTLVTDNAIEYTYTIPLEALNYVSEYKEITEKMVVACVDNDTADIQSLKDNAYLPDDQMSVIYDYTTMNDSLYGNSKTELEYTGFRITQGADDPNLQLFSATYEVSNDVYKTEYVVNIDRNSEKVVFLWLKTDEK